MGCAMKLFDEKKKIQLNKNKKVGVTIRVWHSDAVLLALGKMNNRIKDMKEEYLGIKSEDKKVSREKLNSFTGHATIQIGKEPENYISLWPGATRKNETRSIALKSLKNDLEYFDNHREGRSLPDVEMTLYSLDTDAMLEEWEEFKKKVSKDEVNFSLYEKWQDDDSTNLSCSFLVQFFLNKGGIWNLIEPYVDHKSGAILGAIAGGLAGGIIGGAIVGGLGLALSENVTAPEIVTKTLLGEAAGITVVMLAGVTFGGSIAALVVGIAGLGLLEGILVGAGVGAIAGGVGGLIAGKTVDLSEIQKKLVVTPSDIANLAIQLKRLEEVKYELIYREIKINEDEEEDVYRNENSGMCLIL